MRTQVKTYHVIPHRDGGWCVKRSGANRPSRVGFETRVDAYDWAWRRRGVDEVVVHRATGEIDIVDSRPGRKRTA